MVEDALYTFLYSWVYRVLITDLGYNLPIIRSHQDAPAPEQDDPYIVIDYGPNRGKIGRFSAGDTGDLSTAHKYAPTFATTDINITTNIITITGHSFSDNDLVSFSTTDTLPGGLVAGVYYHIITATTDTFQVSATQGGSAVNITSVGVGNHTITREGQRTLVNDYLYSMEIWEINGAGSYLQMLIDSMGRQEIMDLWNANNYTLNSQGEILTMPRTQLNKWKRESLVELFIGGATGTLETPGFISDLEYTGNIPAQGRSGDHTLTNV
jgi:hypothetical protein